MKLLEFNVQTKYQYRVAIANAVPPSHQNKKRPMQRTKRAYEILQRQQQQQLQQQMHSKRSFVASLCSLMLHSRLSRTQTLLCLVSHSFLKRRRL